MKKEFKSCSLNDMVRDWVACISDYSSFNRNPEQRRCPPEFGKCKVNFDRASYSNPRPRAYGCVMCDYQGNILGAKGGLIGVCDVIHAETMGLLEGLRLAKIKGVSGCIIEGDSTTVISWERGNNFGSWRLHHFYAEIKSLINILKAELVHVPRNQNSLADKLAKWSIGQCNMFKRDSLSEC